MKRASEIKKSVLAYKGHKEAAIFYDQVFPVISEFIYDTNKPNSFSIIGEEIDDIHDKSTLYDIIPRLITGNWDDSNVTLEKDFLSEYFIASKKIFRQYKNRINNCTYPDSCTIYKSDFTNETEIKKHVQFAKNLGFHKPDFIRYYDKMDQARGIDVDTCQEEDNLSDSLMMVLTEVPFLDLSNSSWEQIRELKRDKEANDKLKNLRLYIGKNFNNMNKDHIVDDVCNLYNEIEDARKKHGFTKLNTTLEVLKNTSSIFLDSIINIPLASLGNNFLSFNRSNKRHKKYLDNHPLSFFLHLEQNYSNLVKNDK